MNASDRVKLKIKMLMAAHNMTAYALAQEADLTQNCISNWYGKRQYEPSLSSLEKVCGVFGISMAEMLSDSNEQMVPLDEELRTVYDDWRKLTVAQRQAIIAHISSYIEQ